MVADLIGQKVICEMFTPKKTMVTVLLLLFVLLTSCAQAEPTPTESAVVALPPGEPTPVVVRILNLNLALAASPTPLLPTPTPLPTLAPPTSAPATAESAAASETTTSPSCTNVAEFVKNLSTADNTAFKPEQSFAKIWQIKNAGTCTWSTEYSLVYASGESMGSLPSVPLPHPVNPGELVDLRLNLIAPATPNTYSGSWYLQDASGAVFGLGPDNTQPLGVTIVVRPVPKPPI